MQLRVTVTREEKTVALENKEFAKVIGANGRPTPPWLAKEVVENTPFKAMKKE